jgi:hypothetical protein
MPSANVRIDTRTHQTLKQLADQQNASMQDILARAIEVYRRATFLDAANAEFGALRSRSKDWQAELDEREAWDSTLSDGSRE